MFLEEAGDSDFQRLLSYDLTPFDLWYLNEFSLRIADHPVLCGFHLKPEVSQVSERGSANMTSWVFVSSAIAGVKIS